MLRTQVHSKIKIQSLFFHSHVIPSQTKEEHLDLEVQEDEEKIKVLGVNYRFKILYIVLPCLFQSLAVPLVLGRGPNEKSEQKPREAEEV